MPRFEPVRRARLLFRALRAAHSRDSREWSRRIEGPEQRETVTRW
jgi:hypothetical protein